MFNFDYKKIDQVFWIPADIEPEQLIPGFKELEEKYGTSLMWSIVYSTSGERGVWLQSVPYASFVWTGEGWLGPNGVTG